MKRTHTEKLNQAQKDFLLLFPTQEINGERIPLAHSVVDGYKHSPHTVYALIRRGYIKDRRPEYPMVMWDLTEKGAKAQADLIREEEQST